MISSELAVFPGDLKFKNKFSMDFNQGHHLSLSSMETTMHLGAHADAPYHYNHQGVTIEQVPLKPYIGPCCVIDFASHWQNNKNEKNNKIEIDLQTWIELFKSFEKIIPKENISLHFKRILFKTNTFLNYNEWNNNFSFLSSELVNYLANTFNVTLIGIDTPSVDHALSKSLDTHSAFYKNKIAILEGLDLKNANQGLYQLIALPLKIKGAEASPLRAILLNLNS